MIQPALQDGAFLADVAEAREDAGNFHLWWLGQSGFLVQWEGRHLLLDPYLSDSLTKKYAGTDKPHVRMTGRVVTPERLDFIDVVTSSHNHTDHLDAETLGALGRVNPRLEMFFPEANRATVELRSGLPAERLHGLDAPHSQVGQSGTGVSPRAAEAGPPHAGSCGGFEFHSVPAAHERIEKDVQGRHIYLGYVVRFGPWTIYHSGDTVHFDGLEDLLREWRIDVALLPINGRAPERRVAGNLGGPEAAALAKEIGARLVVPCHYEMFEFNTASPDEFVRAARGLGQPHRVLRAGERFSSANAPS